MPLVPPAARARPLLLALTCLLWGAAGPSWAACPLGYTSQGMLDGAEFCCSNSTPNKCDYASNLKGKTFTWSGSGFQAAPCSPGPCMGHDECYENGKCCYNGSCTDIFSKGGEMGSKVKCPGVDDDAACRAYVRGQCLGQGTADGMRSCISTAGGAYAGVVAAQEKAKADAEAKKKADDEAAAKAAADAKKTKPPPPPALKTQEIAIQGGLKEQGTAKRWSRVDFVAGSKAYLDANAGDAKTDGKAAERLQPFEKGYLAAHPKIKTKTVLAVLASADQEPKDKNPQSGPLLVAGIRSLMRQDVQAYADGEGKTAVDEALPKWTAGLSEGMKLEDALKALPGGAGGAAGPAADPFPKALETLFPGDDGKVPRAVVEFLAKDKAAKDELVAAAAGTDQAAVKAKWTDAATKKIGDHLAAPAADAAFASHLTAKNLTEKDLLGYYCPRRPPPVPGKPAMAQLQTADGQGSAALKSGSAEGASAAAALSPAEIVNGKCGGAGAGAKDSAAGAPTESFKPTGPALNVKEPPKPGGADQAASPGNSAGGGSPAQGGSSSGGPDKTYTRMVGAVAGAVVGGAVGAALLPALGPLGIVIGAVLIAALFLFLIG